MNTKMNLRKRILLGYLVPLALMLGVALAVYWSLGTLRQISDALDQSHKVAEHVKNVHLGLVQMQRSARGYLLLKNDGSRKNYQAAQSLLQDGLQRLTEEVRDRVQLENLRRLSELSGRMEAEEQKYIDLIDAGKTSQALTLFRDGRSISAVRQVLPLEQIGPALCALAAGASHP